MSATPQCAGPVLITGAGGQLGRELLATRPAGTVCTAFSSRDLDITDHEKVRRAVAELAPSVVINAAAYTAVDQAESEPAAAFAVNGEAVAGLAAAARENGAFLVHVSTDFVFDGEKSSPYTPTDPTNPLGVYGRSKLAGEERLAADAAAGRAAVIRTAWLYAAHGKNFVNTMLRLMAERDHLGVVADQVGTPTAASTLARALWQVAARRISGIHHATDAGVASWYDFAVAIMEEAVDLGLLERAIPITPLTTAEYPTPARRPAYSVLDKSTLWREIGPAPHWRASLRRVLAENKEIIK